jgi:hypothetical protein
VNIIYAFKTGENSFSLKTMDIIDHNIMGKPWNMMGTLETIETIENHTNVNMMGKHMEQYT